MRVQHEHYKREDRLSALSAESRAQKRIDAADLRHVRTTYPGTRVSGFVPPMAVRRG